MCYNYVTFSSGIPSQELDGQCISEALGSARKKLVVVKQPLISKEE